MSGPLRLETGSKALGPGTIVKNNDGETRSALGQEAAFTIVNTEVIEHLLTAKQVAEILNVRSKRVYELSIPSVRISERQVRWRLETVKRWIAEREAVA